MEERYAGERAHSAIGEGGVKGLGALSKVSGYSFGDARRTIYLLISCFSHEYSPIIGDRSTFGRPLGDLGPRIRWLISHATVLGLGQISAECCCAIWKASTAISRKQISNDVDREREKRGG